MMIANPPIHPHGHTRGYEGWPDDVREQIRTWDYDRSLSFYRHPAQAFVCDVCRKAWESNPNGDPHVRFGSTYIHFCDDCLITAARPSAGSA